MPGPLAPPVDFAQAGTEAQTVNYAALPNPTALPNPITICPDGMLHVVGHMLGKDPLLMMTVCDLSAPAC